MALTLGDKQDLDEVLRGAFPSRAALNRLFVYYVDKRLTDYVGDNDSLLEAVPKIIEAAESEGWVRQLCEGSVRANPGNTELAAVVARLGYRTSDATAVGSDLMGNPPQGGQSVQESAGFQASTTTAGPAPSQTLNAPERATPRRSMVLRSVSLASDDTTSQFTAFDGAGGQSSGGAPLSYLRPQHVEELERLQASLEMLLEAMGEVPKLDPCERIDVSIGSLDNSTTQDPTKTWAELGRLLNSFVEPVQNILVLHCADEEAAAYKSAVDSLIGIVAKRRRNPGMLSDQERPALMEQLDASSRAISLAAQAVERRVMRDSKAGITRIRDIVFEIKGLNVQVANTGGFQRSIPNLTLLKGSDQSG